jgi:hypothetical protein
MRTASINSIQNDPARAWAPFEPSRDRPWDLACVAHLHRRAAFAAPWSVLKRDESDGPAKSIERLLSGEATTGDGAPAAGFETSFDGMVALLAPSADLTQIQAEWLYRMIFTAHPLRERMTLFWHNHFATSNVKVQSPLLMYRQNSLLRNGALGDFKALLAGIGKDPAMLVWLDSTINKKARPNENYAREVMELFSLGRGHYTEKDIREAARAFTGWFVVRDQFVADARQHDDGEKTVLGQSGKWDGDDIPAILVGQRACAEFLCRKLVREFISDTLVASDALIAPLANSFREARYEIAVPVAMILRSNLFFDRAMRRQRVKSPVEFAVGTIRSLEILNPTVATTALADACSRMGQSLYVPPSVAGWDGGQGWISSTALLARANLALGLLADDSQPFGGRFKPRTLAGRYGLTAQAAAAGFFIDLLVQNGLASAARQQIEKAGGGSAGAGGDAALGEVVRLILTSPEYQLA